jgi:ABC-2 type transport system permease protein
VNASGRAEIFDLGYQRYEGERTGRWRRRQAIWRDGVRISLGLGRGAAAKVAPWLLIAFSLAPIAVLIVLAAFLGSVPTDPDDFDLPSYAEYYEFAIIPLALFAAVIAPLLVCPDRRDGVLSLYAARPITPADYVASRWTAFLTVALALAWIPEAALFAWNLLDARDTGAWVRDNWDVVPRFLTAGAVIAVFLTTLTLFVASFTSRRAYAAIGTFAVLFVGGAVGGIARNNFDGTLADVLSQADLLQALVNTQRWIFGAQLDEHSVPGPVSALWLAALTVVLAAWLLRRTDRMVRG